MITMSRQALCSQIIESNYNCPCPFGWKSNEVGRDLNMEKLVCCIRMLSWEVTCSEKFQ